MADEKPHAPKSSPPVKPTVQERAVKTERPVYRRRFTFPVEAEVQDCSGAVRQEALNLGYRATGDVEVESTKKTNDGLRKVVTYVLPVEGKK